MDGIKLSVQAQKAIVMVVQKGIMEEMDVSELLANLQFLPGEEEGEQRLVCLNPPTLKVPKPQEDQEMEENNE